MTDNSQVLTNSAIVVAMPKQDVNSIKVRSNSIIELKQEMVRNIHYGPPYPGSDRDTLLKPGAEWLGVQFGLRPHYLDLDKTIQYNPAHPEQSFILFRYLCEMIDIQTGVIVGEAIGSCNSAEDKFGFRWLPKSDVPPYLSIETLVTKSGTLIEFDFAINKAETAGKFGKPAEYWQQFKDAIAKGTAIEGKRPTARGEAVTWQIGGMLYRVPNANPFDQLNTIDKMAQKRAFLSAILNATGASAYFAPGDDAINDLYAVEGEIVEESGEKGQSGPVKVEKPAVEQPSNITNFPQKATTPSAPQAEQPAPPPWYIDKMTALLDLLKKDGYITGDTPAELEAAAKALLPEGKKWGDYATGKEAAEALKATWKANQAPAQPKSAPKSKPAPKKLAGDALAEALSFASGTVGLKNGMLEEAIGGKVADMTQAEFDAALIKSLHVHHLPILVSEAKYTEARKGVKVIDLSNPLLTVRVFGGRSGLKEMLDKNGWDGEEWGKLNHLENWVLGNPEPYSIGTLRVWWKTTDEGYTQVEKVEIVDVPF